MKRTIIALATAGLFVGTAAQADVRIDAREANQQRQIDAGKRSGKLTRRERDVLTNEQHMIKRVEARLSRGGLGQRDENRINGMLDRAQAHIEQLKNNRERTRGRLL